MKLTTLPQILQERAEQTPQRLSQRHKHRGIWREYSFAQVRDQVRSLALGLHRLGVERGQTVAVIGENEPEHFWAEVAAQALGCKVVSMYPDLTADETQYLLEDSEAVCLFAQDQEQDQELQKQHPALRRTPPRPAATAAGRRGRPAPPAGRPPAGSPRARPSASRRSRTAAARRRARSAR